MKGPVYTPVHAHLPIGAGAVSCISPYYGALRVSVEM